MARFLLYTAASELGDLGPLAVALTDAGHDAECVTAARPCPIEIDPLRYADAFAEAAADAFAHVVRGARPDAIVLLARDAFVLIGGPPLGHPLTMLLGNGASSTAAVHPFPAGIEAVALRIGSHASDLAAWRAALDRPAAQLVFSPKARR